MSAARVAGAGRARLIGRHLLPNALGVVIVNVTFQVADAILAIAALGFLGFGLQWPNQDWGDLLSNGVTYLQDGYWWQVYPVGACIVLVVMACNLIGDAAPRLRSTSGSGAGRRRTAQWGRGNHRYGTRP